MRTSYLFILMLPLAANLQNGQAQSISFNSPRAYLTGTAVNAVAVGDFNGDGKLDTVVSDPGTNSVSVFLGKGDGTVALAGTFGAGIDPGLLVAADFNGDGKLDLAVVDQSPFSIALLAGNGDGTFQAPVISEIPSTSNVTGIVAGDFNQDSHLDLALAAGVFLYVLTGNGHGAFTQSASYSPQSYPIALAVGDFNNDGHLDLVAADLGEYGSGENVAVLLGNGDGTFQAPKYHAAGQSPFGVAVGDFNRDGKLDVAVTDDSSPAAVVILLGNGDGAFQTGQHYPVGADAAQVLTADFNSDGRPDLAVETSTGTAILLGNGDGTFQGKQGDRINALAAGDFNGDGSVDLVGLAGGPVVMLGNGKGNFQGVNAFTTANSADSVTIADLNLDGTPDLAVVDIHLGTVAILLGTANGNVGPPALFPAGRLAGKAVVADFNGNGKPDLAIPIGGTNGDNVSILLSQGNGAFSPAVGYACGTGQGVALTVADFNNDGAPDLAVITGAQVCVLISNGDGTFHTGPQSKIGGAALSIVAGDFNRDGYMDIAVTIPESNSIVVLFGNGQGAFGTPLTYPGGEYPQQIAAASTTGAGILDLIVSNQGNPEGSVSVLLGNGDGTFHPASTYPVGYKAGALAIADFNADGKLDIAVAVGGFQEVSILPGNGDGTFAAPIANALASVYGGTDLAIGDFNHDGKPDLAIANGGENCVSILTNNSH